MWVTVRRSKNTQVMGPEQRFVYNRMLSGGWNYLVGEVVYLSPITVSVRASRTAPAGMHLTHITLPQKATQFLPN